MELLALLLSMAVIYILVLVVNYAITSLLIMLLFKKAGHPKPGAAWIPFYNIYLLLIFAGQKPYWFWVGLGSFLLVLLPADIGAILAFVISIALTIVTIYGIIFINKSFGKQEIVLWTLFGFFLTPIWMLVIALGDNYYNRASGPVFLSKDGTPPDAW